MQGLAVSSFIKLSLGCTGARDSGLGGMVSAVLYDDGLFIRP